MNMDGDQSIVTGRFGSGMMMESSEMISTDAKSISSLLDPSVIKTIEGSFSETIDEYNSMLLKSKLKFSDARSKM